MRVELSRATFIRLVQLYIATGILSAGAAVYFIFSSSWQPFNNEFDLLVERHFVEPDAPDWLLWVVAGLLATILVWMIASMFGLLWFKRWARTGVWASLLALLGLAAVTFGTSPSATTLMDDALAIVDSALLGAILLLAYADGLGADWFALPGDLKQG
jgi:hypothetical protein